MLTTATKAVMLLAAFAICFALVCPVAVTPMPVQKHGIDYVATAPIALNAALVLAFFAIAVSPLVTDSIYLPPDPSDLNCVRNC